LGERRKGKKAKAIREKSDCLTPEKKFSSGNNKIRVDQQTRGKERGEKEGGKGKVGRKRKRTLWLQRRSPVQVAVIEEVC
jgi:hypothetical protein